MINVISGPVQGEGLGGQGPPLFKKYLNKIK